VLDDRTRLIMLYAMCGFANFGTLGFKSIVSGTLSTMLMGAMVGVLS